MVAGGFHGRGDQSRCACPGAHRCCVHHCTRWSAFDAMVAGCMSVFFHPGSAYLQYRWHLPGDHARYSVFIPEDGVHTGNVSIEEALRRIPAVAMRKMREDVVKLVPRLVYVDPRYRLETAKDAFDVAVGAVVEKVAEMRRRESDGGEVRSSWLERFLSK